MSISTAKTVGIASGPYTPPGVSSVRPPEAETNELIKSVAQGSSKVPVIIAVAVVVLVLFIVGGFLLLGKTDKETPLDPSGVSSQPAVASPVKVKPVKKVIEPTKELLPAKSPQPVLVEEPTEPPVQAEKQEEPSLDEQIEKPDSKKIVAKEEAVSSLKKKKRPKKKKPRDKAKDKVKGRFGTTFVDYED